MTDHHAHPPGDAGPTTADGTAVVEPDQSGRADARIDEILTVLDRLDDVEVAHHTEIYLEIHDRLSAELNPGIEPDRNQNQNRNQTPGRSSGHRRAGAHGAP